MDTNTNTNTNNSLVNLAALEQLSEGDLKAVLGCVKLEVWRRNASELVEALGPVEHLIHVERHNKDIVSAAMAINKALGVPMPEAYCVARAFWPDDA